MHIYLVCFLRKVSDFALFFAGSALDVHFDTKCIRTFCLCNLHWNLDITNKSVDPFCSLYRIIHYIKCNMISKSSRWELGLVHYIAKFTISRFVIFRFECIQCHTHLNLGVCAHWNVPVECFTRKKIMQHDSMKNDESNCGFELFCKNFSLSTISEIFFTT